MKLPLVAFSNENAARLLISHLNAHGIQASYQTERQSDQQGHLVCLSNPEDAESAKVLTQKFLENPHSSQYQQDAWAAGEQSSQPIDFNLSALDLRHFSKAPFSVFIAGLCLVVFLFMSMGGFSWVADWLFIQSIATLSDNHQWWRLFSPDIIHFSALHLVFNILWWLILGAKVERLMGLSTLVILFVVSSLAANLGQLWVSGPNFGGLSGVVYALMGFVWWLGWLRPEWKVSLPKPIIGFMLVWLVIGYADLLWVSTANTAHTLGLVSGCLLAFLYSQTAKRSTN